jgi:hypothetical protein
MQSGKLRNLTLAIPSYLSTVRCAVTNDGIDKQTRIATANDTVNLDVVFIFHLSTCVLGFLTGRDATDDYLPFLPRVEIRS